MLETLLVGLLLVLGIGLGMEISNHRSSMRVFRGDGAWLEVWHGDELVSEWRPEDGVAYETIALFLAK